MSAITSGTAGDAKWNRNSSGVYLTVLSGDELLT